MEAIIGIGSNKGDRLALILSAFQALRSVQDMRIVGWSSIYESTAHILPGARRQAKYLNAVAVLETDVEPEILLGVCLDIESKHGRIRSKNTRWESRTLDMDIISLGDIVRNSESLMIPHPRLAERRFVLEPLAEIRSKLQIPHPFDRPVQYLLDNCPDRDSLRVRFPRSSIFDS